MAQTNGHVSVLPAETLECLVPRERRSLPLRIIDGTVGLGGHSRRILEACPRAEILGIDRDESALAVSRERLAFVKDRVHLFHGVFSDMERFASDLNWSGVDGILLDIGVSSPQIDDPARGFSWRSDGPLDMRMDPTRGRTAAELLQNADEKTLAAIFRDYGEIAESRKLARAVIEQRAASPFRTCGVFASLCDRILPKNGRSGPPSPTLPFQALRIAVNDELGELERALKASLRLLNAQGRLCVISFHSLEDRIVKHFFQEMAVECKCPPGCPVCICGWTPKLKIVTKKPVEASEAERESNTRSRCARLRAAERCAEKGQENQETKQ